MNIYTENFSDHSLSIGFVDLWLLFYECVDCAFKVLNNDDPNKPNEKEMQL